MTMRTFSLNLLIPTIFLFSCAINQDYFQTPLDEVESYNKKDTYHTVYFLGNSDDVRLGDSKLGQLLATQTEESGKNSTLLLLGNNSLRHNILSNDSSRKAMERRELLRNRYEFFKALRGNYYGVMGPHEWSNGNKKGMDNVRILEEILEDQFDQGNVIRPANGCPGPEEIEIGKNLVLLLIDTQWLFHSWDKPKIENGCGAEGNLDFYVNLDDAIKRNYNKKIIVAGYHGLVSNGPHGGFFPTKSHFIPLPLIGSLDVGRRALFGNANDLSNPNYGQFIKVMTETLKNHKDVIYLSAHEKTLEYHYHENMHLLNSGSYSSGVEVGQKNAKFASGKRGYGRILFNKDGTVVLEYWGVNEDRLELLFQSELYNQWQERSIEDKIAAENLNYADSVKTTFASKMYTKKGTKPGMLGNNYRQEWITPIQNIPYFDIGKEKGGMDIVKRGGGQQTISLRLEAKKDKQYVLRSIEKYPENAVPVDLRNTVAVDIVTDQISAAHPYGAFAVPKMAEAAGIYHTNPKLVYIPDDPRLGIYRQMFGDGLYLFEERPAKNRTDIKSFGRSKDIVNTFEVLKELRNDGDHYVDQVFTLRSRLFDIFIGDWDRHDDQWRWASFRDDDGNKFYRPIPRDRDQAFFWSDGWLLKIASHNWGVAKFQGFHDKIRDVDGLCFNARYFDRSFMNEPPRETWISIAKDLQYRMRDEVIENSIRDMPEEIFKLHGENIIRKLKARREDLIRYAEEYYEFLAKEVDVRGSNKNEHFVVERQNDTETKVSVYLLKSKSSEVKRKMYERTFNTSETDEIRLFGFNGDDLFDISGEVANGIKIRIIGGKGDDIVNDRSQVSGISRKTILYDTKSGTQLNTVGETRNLTSDRDPLINDYNRKMFQYDVTTPLLYLSYNPDDKIFLGGGVMIKKHGFRKSPFKARHVIRADFAPASKSYDFSYKGVFTEVIGKWNFHINANIYAPSFTDYFYGYGNETPFDNEKFNNDQRYYSARYLQYIFYPEINKKSKNELHEITIGGGYQMVNVKSDLNDINNEQERFIISYANSLNYDLLDQQRDYLALYTRYTFDNTNNSFMPQRGLRWNIFAIGLEDIDEKEIDVDFQRIRSDLSYYYTFGKLLKTTIALRAGGIYTNGRFEFYHAAKLGGSNNFRGVRKFRLAGQHSFYQNTDLRIKLFDIKNPILPTSLGLVLFHDFGRVWFDNDPSTGEGDSNKMHRAYGGGIWLAPLNSISIGADYSWSTMDESAFFLRMGFFF